MCFFSWKKKLPRMRIYLKLDSVTRSNQNQIFRTAVGIAELPAPRVIGIWDEIKIFQHQLRVFKFSLNIIIDDCHVCSSWLPNSNTAATFLKLRSVLSRMKLFFYSTWVSKCSLRLLQKEIGSFIYALGHQKF